MMEAYGTTHCDDGDLIRHLHGETDAHEQRSMADHLDVCGECRGRLSTLEAGAADVSDLLASLTAAPREVWVNETRAKLRATPPAIPTWLRMAAGIGFVVLATGALSLVPPVRAWVAARFADVGTDTPATVAAPPATSVEAPVTASLEFDPQSPEFVVRLAARQGTGRVTVEFADADRATVQVLGGSNEQILLLPNGVTIQNEGQSVASYRFILPAGIRSIQVIAGGEMAGRHSRADGGDRSWVLDLDGSGAP